MNYKSSKHKQSSFSLFKKIQKTLLVGRIKNLFLIITLSLAISILSVTAIKIFVRDISPNRIISLILSTDDKVSDVEIDNNDKSGNNAEKDRDEVISRLISMQANTLTIASIAVTLATVILGTLSYIQNKQTENFRKQYEETVQKTHNLFAMTIIQSLSVQKFYVKADILMAEELKQLSKLKTDDKGLYLFSNIQCLLAAEKEVNILSRQGEISPEDEMDSWNAICELSEEILNMSSYTFASIRYVVKIKYIYAKYQMCRLIRQTDRQKALIYIKEADKILQQISENEVDPYGNLDNLRGLVHLWKYKCEEDMDNHSAESYAKKYQDVWNLFKHAFDAFIKMEPYSDCSMIRNHLGVAKINEARCHLTAKRKKWIKKTKNCLQDADKTFRDILKTNPNYTKAYLNRAHINCLFVKLYLGDYFAPFLISFANLYEHKHKYKAALQKLKDAKKYLKSAKDKEETLPDVDFRMFEILSWELALTQRIQYGWVDLQKINRYEKKMVKLLIDRGLLKGNNENVDLLKKVPQGDTEIILGFVEPWRNYVFWRATFSPSNEKKGWYDAADKLNNILIAHHKKSAYNWKIESNSRKIKK